MPKITFMPSGTVLDCRDGETVFDVARDSAITVETACVGKGTCGLCRVKVLEGEDHLSSYNEVEEKHLGNVYFLTKVRLACQCVVTGGDVVVEPAPKKRRRKAKR